MTTAALWLGVGSLLLALAKFAYDCYRDWRKKKAETALIKPPSKSDIDKYGNPLGVFEWADSFMPSLASMAMAIIALVVKKYLL